MTTPSLSGLPSAASCRQVPVHQHRHAGHAAQVRLFAYFTAGAGFCNLTLATSDQTLLNGLVDGDTLTSSSGTRPQPQQPGHRGGVHPWQPGFSAVLGIEDATEQDRAADFALGVPTFSGALDKTEVAEHDSAADFALGIPSFSVALAKRVPADRTGPIATSLDAGIAQMKRTLLAGGLLRSIEWHQRTGDKDERGATGRLGIATRRTD